ncbi:MBL fold metallo-hydrolase [Croceicoccus sp. F390]|uniref:MBL fold metallo-hydrolase n=1 Tax=Croceicoccus esteveae TaxID=3075597 RepID=A0ABU2ZJ68_9SPHN|nr:MBL fold metallo-hydrolase [Croceicoccus sp. F390]MDT0576639.1 MBL fold metallo-hydrolase [Croceicoccus sp. F390]
MKLFVLGCGTSTGVPRIGNDWGACDPKDARNRRTRVSIIVESDGGERVLVDTSPDLRHQLLAANIDRIDAVCWTHDHADHCHGIDDLRALRYGRGGPIPAYGTEETVRRLRQRFGYVFAGQHGYSTICNIETLDRLKLLCGMRLSWCRMPHGPAQSTAYRFDAAGKSIGYATDFSEIRNDLVDLFTNLDVLVVDCLRREPHPTHAHLSMSLDLAAQTQSKRVILTHLDKSMDYTSLVEETPSHVYPAYDGMVIAL